MAGHLEASPSSDSSYEEIDMPPDEQRLESASSGSLAGASDSGQEARKWFGKLRSGIENYKFGDITRHVVSEATPHIREKVHNVRQRKEAIKSSLEEKRHKIVQSVVAGLDLVDDPSASSRPAAYGGAPDPTCVEVTKSWWTSACAAAHAKHDLASGVPAPSADGLPPDGDASVRGCLEVALLGFGTNLTHIDGSQPFDPVCQFALGSRYTGAVRPLDEGIGKLFCGDNCSARFAIDEFFGRDLRVHVFDSKAKSFDFGMEHLSCCGGALVPLSMLLRRSATFDHCFNAINGRSIELKLVVALLPLDAIRGVQKLKPASATGLERPQNFMSGHVRLQLRLTIFDTIPSFAYVALPFRGVPRENLGAGGQVDDPMSVLKAVATAWVRVHAAAQPDVWLRAADELLEWWASLVALHVLWAYAALVVPVWKLPAYLFCALVMLLFQVSVVAQRTKLNNPPVLYKEAAVQQDLSLKDRGKQFFTQGLKMELSMMQFAENLNSVAIMLEKVRYVATLQDPFLTFLIGTVVTGMMVAACVALWVLTAITGSAGVPILAWSCGCAVLLPKGWRSRALRAARSLKDTIDKTIGTRGSQMCLALWQRIPDGLEVQHSDLVQRYVVVP